MRRQAGGWQCFLDNYKQRIQLHNAAVQGEIDITCYSHGNDRANADVKAKVEKEVVGESRPQAYVGPDKFVRDTCVRVDLMIDEITKFHETYKDPKTGKYDRSRFATAIPKAR